MEGPRQVGTTSDVVPVYVGDGREP